MATKKKKKPARPRRRPPAAAPETLDELQGRVARRMAEQVAAVRDIASGSRAGGTIIALDGRDYVRRKVLEAIDAYLDEVEG
jgi:hypothetical protein